MRRACLACAVVCECVYARACAATSEQLFGTLREAEKRRKEEEESRGAARKALPNPKLPSHLAGRKRDVLQLYQQFENRSSSVEASAASRGGMNLMASGAVPNFEAALRLYYPKDSRETIAALMHFINETLAARAALSDAKTEEADAELIRALDKDGNGRISLTEFCELSKITGLNRSQMREHFRAADLGNSGELSLDQMREVLRTLRREASKARAKSGAGTLAESLDNAIGQQQVRPTLGGGGGPGRASGALLAAASRAGFGVA